MDDQSETRSQPRVGAARQETRKMQEYSFLTKLYDSSKRDVIRFEPGFGEDFDGCRILKDKKVFVGVTISGGLYCLKVGHEALAMVVKFTANCQQAHMASCFAVSRI